MTVVSNLICKILLSYIPRKVTCIHFQENILPGLNKIYLTVCRKACFQFEAHSKYRKNERRVFFKIKNAMCMIL